MVGGPGEMQQAEEFTKKCAARPYYCSRIRNDPSNDSKSFLLHNSLVLHEFTIDLIHWSLSAGNHSSKALVSIRTPRNVIQVAGPSILFLETGKPWWSKVLRAVSRVEADLWETSGSTKQGNGSDV